MYHLGEAAHYQVSKLLTQVYGQGTSSDWPADEEAPDVECHICMDAEVEVESLPCKHR